MTKPSLLSLPVSVSDADMDALQHTEFGSYPTDWRMGTIGDSEPFVTSGSRGWSRYYSQVGDPFIRIGNLSHDSVDVNVERLRLVELDKDASVEADRTRLQHCDLLISITADIGAIGFVHDRVPLPAYINQHIALVRFDASRVDSRYAAYVLSSRELQRLFTASMDVGAKAGMSLITVRTIPMPHPPIAEQRAIAGALSDADGLVESLERLLTKKRRLKLGAMQQLLTATRRLPGFEGEWETRTLGELAHIKTGTLDNQDKVEDGDYPFFVRSDTIEHIDRFTHECEAILVPGEGGIGSIFHYVSGRFAVHQRVYAVTGFSTDTQGRFLYYYMVQFFGAHAMQNTVKATVDSLRLPTFQQFEVTLPPINEQRAISTILSDMDAEITALEAKLEKARRIKQGMMQQLLTGSIRLPVKSEGE